jgi:hypothetical protein
MHGDGAEPINRKWKWPMTETLLKAAIQIALVSFLVSGGSETWPGDPRDLCFVWPDRAFQGQEPPFSEALPIRRVLPVGRASIDNAGAMRLFGGAFRVDPDRSHKFCRQARATGVISVELLMSPQRGNADAAGVVAGLFSDGQASNLEITHKGDELWLKLVTRMHVARPVHVKLGSVEPEAATHVLLFYVAAAPNDKLYCYLDGKLSFSGDYDGGFSNWFDQQIVFGNDLSGERAWRGTIAKAAIDHRTYSAEAAEQRHRMAVAEQR